MPRIAVFPDYQDSRVVTLSFHEDFVQVFKILVVTGDDRAIVANGMSQVNGVLSAHQAYVGWDLHVMSGVAQELQQQPSRAIVIKVEPHERVSRDFSWGGRILG